MHGGMYRAERVRHMTHGNEAGGSSRRRGAAPRDYAALNLTTEIATLTAVDCGRCAATEPLLPVPAASGVAESTRRRFCPASQQSQAPAPHPRGAWLRAPSVDCHLPDSLCFHASAESSPPFESPDPRVAAT